ncbi:hypothetical protein SAMN04487905_11856 [Actinopolyspora xinjiangensis]|uniref:Uncharacterized protein n=1 Tax=Actinopolyspora xinjiangensis TaxID=405564 RepID=A0A1H0WZG5_9ACTN|nr:hypothetical protein SAMN04487905_11856 [Actinopolyspora xinjiangensis]
MRPVGDRRVNRYGNRCRGQSGRGDVGVEEVGGERVRHHLRGGPVTAGAGPGGGNPEYEVDLCCGVIAMSSMVVYTRRIRITSARHCLVATWVECAVVPGIAECSLMVRCGSRPGLGCGGVGLTFRGRGLRAQQCVQGSGGFDDVEFGVQQRVQQQSVAGGEEQSCQR